MPVWSPVPASVQFLDRCFSPWPQEDEHVLQAHNPPSLEKWNSVQQKFESYTWIKEVNSQTL